MSGVEPLQAEDVEEAAGLFEHVRRSGSRRPPQRLVAYLHETLLEHPWADPELPSLVYRDDSGRIVGLVGTHTRRFAADGGLLRAAFMTSWITDPEYRDRPVGLFLLRAFLAGPQDVSVAETSSRFSRPFWERLAGPSASFGGAAWLRVFRPVGYLAARVFQGRSGAASRPLDTVAARIRPFELRLEAAVPRTRPLTPQIMLNAYPEVASWFAARPAYDLQFLEWTFEHVARVTAHGRLEAKLVVDDEERPLGWFTYYLRRHGASEVLQIVARPGTAQAVVDALLADARDGGAQALRGRAEPYLTDALTLRGAILRWGGELLVHARERPVGATFRAGDALLSRFDGCWWMAYELL